MEVLKYSLLVVLVTTSSCKKDEKKPDSSFCDKSCEQIVRCSKEIKTKSRKEKIIQNHDKCLSSCKNLIDGKGKPEEVKFYRYFFSLQKPCFESKECDAFMSCRSQKYKDAIDTYPMDKITAERCKKVCAKLSGCASAIVPSMMGKNFKDMPLDKQAEVIKKRSDSGACVHMCRRYHVREVIESDLSGRDKIDAFFSEYNRALNCVGHKDCGAFAKCAFLQAE
ncbi:hypothetical protein KKF34_13525 [Myxococcota bacterium]|nr:hypothetical protein [Myxococcota bacterium]MBU1380560.1 hypothetical protein [Myxococcota bacterium]MBU1497890.1 hypothetical protein [Myxococcota bacterium]